MVQNTQSSAMVLKIHEILKEFQVSALELRYLDINFEIQSLVVSPRLIDDEAYDNKRVTVNGLTIRLSETLFKDPFISRPTLVIMGYDIALDEKLQEISKRQENSFVIHSGVKPLQLLGPLNPNLANSQQMSSPRQTSLLLRNIRDEISDLVASTHCLQEFYNRQLHQVDVFEFNCYTLNCLQKLFALIIVGYIQEMVGLTYGYDVQFCLVKDEQIEKFYSLKEVVEQILE